jgi:hypothetical protein
MTSATKQGGELMRQAQRREGKREGGGREEKVESAIGELFPTFLLSAFPFFFPVLL